VHEDVKAMSLGRINLYADAAPGDDRASTEPSGRPRAEAQAQQVTLEHRNAPERQRGKTDRGSCETTRGDGQRT
jgi:hypothetical protein